jgi:transposase
MEDWVVIRTLRSRGPDLGTRAIAELPGISRNTVKSALASERAPQYGRASVTNPQIEPFVELVTDCYLAKSFRVSRFLAELQSKGCAGSRTALCRWIEAELEPKREAQAAQAFQPYQTKPGKQMLYDWAEYRCSHRGAHQPRLRPPVRAVPQPWLRPLHVRSTCDILRAGGAPCP